MRSSIGGYSKDKGDYHIEIINGDITESNISMAIIVFGKNKEVSKIVMSIMI